ncbi:hypothetical protein [Kocuria carniphila]|uniref:hypothetical protein n=1 Tax=Kocuria carniphila TaxID=262208 RepID=UPI0034CFF0DC
MASKRVFKSKSLWWGVAIGFLLLVVFFLGLSWGPPQLMSDGSVNANTWVGFFGNIVAAGVGGGVAVYVLSRSIRHEQQARVGEGKRLRDDQIVMALQELGDMANSIQTACSMPDDQLRDAALRMNRQIVKVGLTLENNSESQQVFSVLTQASRAFQLAARSHDTEEHKWWLCNHLLPSVEHLTNVVIVRTTDDSATEEDVYSTAGQLEALIQDWLYEWIGPYPEWTQRQWGDGQPGKNPAD